MLDLLNYKDKIDEIEIGQTIRINHDSCGAGADTRRRLYITRPEANPEKAVAYCHNCQEGGVLTTGEYTKYRDQRHSTVKETTVLDLVARPTTLETVLNEWPSDAQAWAIKNRLSQDNIDQYKIGFDTSTHRVYLPRYSEIADAIDERNLMGYQLRKVREDNSPKYLTVSASEDKGFTFIHNLLGDKQGAVLVEDLVSGIKVADACYNDSLQMDVIVNYGTKVNLEALYACKNHQKFIVWLDNDSEHVWNQATTMARTWRLLAKVRGAESQVITSEHSDPKHYKSGVICDILKGAAWTPST